MQTYQKELGSRLLNKTSVSQDSEELMLAKLKMEVGIETTNKMEQMFIDMPHSQELQSKFEDLHGRKEIEGVEFDVKILAKAKWPVMEIY